MGEYDSVVGVLLLGLFFNTYLYGICTFQFLVYVQAKFKDSWWIRCVVGSLFITDTIHSAVAIYAGWETCVTNYANPANLAYVGWTIPFTAVATSFTAILTQIFLGHRVYLMTDSKPLFVLIGALSVLGFLFGCIAGIKSGIINERAFFWAYGLDLILTFTRVAKFAPLAPYVTSWLAFQTSADLLITLCLTFTLARSKTGFRTTDSIINRLIRGTIQTGLFASIFALADLFSFLLHRNTNLYAMFAYPIGRIYTNTLLNTLNSRANMKLHDTVVDSDASRCAFRSCIVHLRTQNLRLSTQTLSRTHVSTGSIYVRKDVVTDSMNIDDRSEVEDKYQG
ncbi:hypothetical protein DFH09DRAFT_1266308 [Mycena vulgaris]|nr:hypothetical protein DFH09DRAFT_1266308 [Mycena vulgaris]